MKNRIKLLRKELGLTQEKFAERLSMKRNTIANYEIGRNEPIDAVISLICKEYNVNEEWLRTGEGDIFKKRLPADEVAYFVEDLLEYDGNGNPFYDMIIEMMKTYRELDDKSQTVIKNYFGVVKESINKKKED